jgi:hypothetical protein
VAAVLVRVICPVIADPVALGERPVEQDVLRFVLAQDLEGPDDRSARRSMTAVMQAWAVLTEIPKRITRAAISLMTRRISKVRKNAERSPPML